MTRPFAFLLALALLCGCASSPRISSDYDHSADFTHYRTFAFFDKLGTDDAGYESLVTQTLKASARREMEARGYVYAEGDPDLRLNFNAHLREKTEVSSAAPPPVYYGARGRYGSGFGYGSEIDTYTEGTLSVDLVDARANKVVWGAIARGRVTEQEREKRAAALDAAVTEIFAEYPFRAPGS